MTTVTPSQSPHCTPFVPVLKADAATLLRVCAKTIDNYIAQGLLPKPTRFGMREMWHPDIFYAYLSRALLGDGLPAAADKLSEPVETTEATPMRHEAPKPPTTKPVVGRKLTRRMAEINQRHAT